MDCGNKRASTGGLDPRLLQFEVFFDVPKEQLQHTTYQKED
jgi:hypothetical protein